MKLDFTLHVISRLYLLVFSKFQGGRAYSQAFAALLKKFNLNRRCLLDSDKKPVIGIVGGTGDLGTGIARRLTRAGYAVVIGSRTADNAHIACDALKQAAEAGGWGCHSGL